MWGWIKPILESIFAYLDLRSRTRQGAKEVDPTAGGRKSAFQRIVLRGMRGPGRTDRP